MNDIFIVTRLKSYNDKLRFNTAYAFYTREDALDFIDRSFRDDLQFCDCKVEHPGIKAMTHIPATGMFEVDEYVFDSLEFGNVVYSLYPASIYESKGVRNGKKADPKERVRQDKGLGGKPETGRKGKTVERVRKGNGKRH